MPVVVQGIHEGVGHSWEFQSDISLLVADLITLHRDLSVVGVNEALDVLRADLVIHLAQATLEQVVKLENVRSG